jgi:hypothetical protein
VNLPRVRREHSGIRPVIVGEILDDRRKRADGPANANRSRGKGGRNTEPDTAKTALFAGIQRHTTGRSRANWGGIGRQDLIQTAQTEQSVRVLPCAFAK